MYKINGFLPVVRCVCGREHVLLRAEVCECGVTLRVKIGPGRISIPRGIAPGNYDLTAQPFRMILILDWAEVGTRKCGYNAPGIAVAGTQTPPEKMRELQDYATKATADLRAELSRVHHEKEDALDRLSRTEQNVAALKAELKNVKRMWKETIERKKEIEAALRRFADISLVEPVDLEKFAYDILNARKALKGE